MVLASDPWLIWLIRHCSKLFKPPLDDEIFPFAPATFNSRISAALKALRIDPALFTAAGLRAGGATFQVRCGMSLDVLRLRGRWSHQKSLERYVQEAAAFLAENQIRSTVRATVEYLGKSALAILKESLAEVELVPFVNRRSPFLARRMQRRSEKKICSNLFFTAGEDSNSD